MSWSKERRRKFRADVQKIIGQERPEAAQDGVAAFAPGPDRATVPGWQVNRAKGGG